MLYPPLVSPPETSEWTLRGLTVWGPEMPDPDWLTGGRREGDTTADRKLRPGRRRETSG